MQKRNKDFKKWHGIKENLDGRKSEVFFHEREIWWCSLGVNIGFEQDGTGKDFQRPIVIIKKFNLDACLAVPLTTTQKKGKYYFKVGEVDGREATAVFSQVRFINRKRLANKVGVLEENIFNKLFEAIIQVNFNKKES
ncbi:MAG: type II toxin-antitoxin system PemK/MazF family toxin [Candidatus Yanofskybacteria bacterium]|nr:type II toxin-antitoxin system PemK/MazF family toxin [Candidatus Yanofskybacteria bacterium]